MINEEDMEYEETRTRRGPGRLKIVRTGKASRPKKDYNKKDETRNEPTRR
jgi:hypothetical protein